MCTHRSDQFDRRTAQLKGYDVSERNIRLTIEYAGTEYCGWQSQKGDATIQDKITAAIARVTGQKVNLTGAGRTDAGVHALGQVANFKIEHSLEAERFRDAINYYLPDDIRIVESIQAADQFHARFDAKFRRYRYLVGLKPTAIYRHQRWFQRSLDIKILNQAAELITGEHDFKAFCVVSSQKEDNRCIIEHSRWRQVGPLLIYEVRGNRFLHSMVRSLVGAMVNMSRTDTDLNPQNLTLDRLGDILDAPGEERVVFTAPAHGLYLVSVGY